MFQRLKFYHVNYSIMEHFRLTESWHVFLKSTSQSSNTESGHNNAGHRYKSGKTTLSWLPWKQREQQTLANEETGM